MYSIMSSQGNAIDPTEAQRIVTIKKRNFTRQFNALGKLTAFAGQNPSSYAVSELNKCKEKFHTAYGELCDALDTFLELEPKFEKDHDLILDESQQRFEDMIQRTLACLTDISAPPTTPGHAPPNPAGGAIAAPQTTRLMEGLKPPILTKDFTPVEYKSWVRKFRSYFNTGRVDRLQVEDQQSVWRICVDPHIEERIADQMTDTTPVFGVGGVMDMLDEDFQTKYPLTTRRADYFRLQQKEGQPFSEHMAKLLRIAKEAELAALTVDDLHCFRLISSVTDKKLREKFLKLETPTLADLTKAVRAYERVQATCDALDEEDNQARARPIKTAPSTTKPDDRRPDRRTDKKKAPHCFACGSPDHLRNICKLRDSTCTFCQKRGHTEAVCRSKLSSTQPSTRPNFTPKAPERAKARAVRAELDDEVDGDGTDDEGEARISRILHRVSNIRVQKDTPRLNVQVSTRFVSFDFQALPDSGATK